MKRTLSRVALVATLATGMVGVAPMVTTLHAGAAGPEGCVAQTNNGVLAAGTVTDGTPGAPPGSPSATCTYNEPAGSVGGGWAGGDQVSWKVTTTINVAADNTGQPCGFVADPPPVPPNPQTYSASGSGQSSGGLGCLAPGAVVTVLIG